MYNLETNLKVLETMNFRHYYIVVKIEKNNKPYKEVKFNSKIANILKMESEEVVENLKTNFKAIDNPKYSPYVLIYEDAIDARNACKWIGFILKQKDVNNTFDPFSIM